MEPQSFCDPPYCPASPGGGPGSCGAHLKSALTVSGARRLTSGCPALAVQFSAPCNPLSSLRPHETWALCLTCVCKSCHWLRACCLASFPPAWPGGCVVDISTSLDCLSARCLPSCVMYGIPYRSA